MSYQPLKNIFLLCLLFGIIFFAYNFYDRQFRFSNIKLEQLKGSDHSIKVQPSEIVEEILAQPFRYLDRGKQSFAFISQDYNYVLKFFDARCGRSLYETIFSVDDTDSCQRRIQQLEAGYRLAYERDRTHSGLIFLQLTPNPELELKITVTDRFGIDHAIDLSQVPFVLQQKAVPTRTVLSKLLDAGNIEGAKLRLRQIVDMYVDEYKEGIWDRDHNFMYNTGFVGNQPIRIDVGRLRSDERMKDPAVYLVDLNKTALQRTSAWMQRHFPQYRDEIETDMQIKLLSIRHE